MQPPHPVIFLLRGILYINEWDHWLGKNSLHDERLRGPAPNLNEKTALRLEETSLCDWRHC
ncbi:MAG: hypothetical protein DHS20C05_08510 [Hyphococcus sp.]|nr:MAG: hypothetical protein DHS20C05_08510 [Marinicaulis sp.]